MRAIWFAALLLWSLASTAAPTDRNEAWRLLNDREFAPLDAAFNGVQLKYEAEYLKVPDAERTLARTFRVFYFADESTGPIYDAWIKAYPRSYAASLARGEYLTALAWKRRGSEFADKISPDQWAATHKVAAMAIAELSRSLTLTARPTLTFEFLIELSMMTSAGNSAELLAQAFKLDPQAYYPSRAFLLGARPQWGGSLEEMRAFVATFAKLNPPAWKLNCLEAMIADMESSEEITRDPELRLTAMTRAIELCPQASRYDVRAHRYRQENRYELAEKDYRESLRLDSGGQWTRASLGLQLLDRGNAEEGVALCREAAKAFEPTAFQCMAYAYSFGKGVSMDKAEVVRWLERSAAAGQRAGMYDLAGHYWRGEGVAQNKGKAVELWRQSAAKGHEPARSKLQELGFAP